MFTHPAAASVFFRPGCVDNQDFHFLPQPSLVRQGVLREWVKKGRASRLQKYLEQIPDKDSPQCGNNEIVLIKRTLTFDQTGQFAIANSVVRLDTATH